jgi:hypothetical protein
MNRKKGLPTKGTDSKTSFQTTDFPQLQRVKISIKKPQMKKASTLPPYLKASYID